MATLNVGHTSAAPDSLNDEYGLAKSKEKEYARVYKRVIRTGASTQRELFIMNDNPDFDRYQFLLIHNIGAEEAFIRVDSGANSSYHRLPIGKTLHFFSNNIWNNGSATTPDTTDGFYVIGNTGIATDATVKVTAFI